MALPTAISGRGRINGLHRSTQNRITRALVQSNAHTHLVVLGSGLYSIALLFPVIVKQVSVAVVLAAIVGTALLLVGLHLRWTRRQRR